MNRPKTTDQEISRKPPRDEKTLDITSDSETLGVVFEGIRLLSAGISLNYIGYTVYNLTRLDVPGVKTVLIVDLIELLITGLIFFLSHTRRVREARVNALSSTLALSVAVNIAISVRIYAEPSDLQYMIAVVLGGAATVVSVRWLVLVLVGTIGVGIWAVLGVCSHNQLIDFIVSQVGATIVSVIIFIGRVRGFRTVARFRLRDEQKTLDLKRALERAEREFQEHELAEKQNTALMEQLRQSQKLEALGTLAGGIAHDINNVIGAITAIASTTVRDLPSGAEGRKELKQILVAARRGTTLTRNLVRFARQEPPKSAPFSIDDVVTEVEALLRRTIDKRISIETNRGCAGWTVMGDAGLISHALMNLCLNAAEAVNEQGKITLTTRTVVLEGNEAEPLGIIPGNYVELLVSDDGCGMMPEVRERAFEPFFTTKEHKRRSGLGLPMVYGSIQQHRGGLKIDSEPGRGTTIRIVLPASEQPALVEERKRSKIPSVDSIRPLVLFVDDEPLLRKAGKRMLKSLGYEAITASDGRDALEKFTEFRHRIGAVVLDVAMPNMNGVECCQELRRIDPKIPVILASGYTKGHDLQSQLATPNTRYLRKPYELDDLAENLAELAEAFREFARMSCQVHCVRISTPSQRNAVSLAPATTIPSKKSGDVG